jgi:hypothetical protein
VNIGVGAVFVKGASDEGRKFTPSAEGRRDERGVTVS